MRYTPVELRHVKMGRSLFGYRRPDTDRLLEDVADSFEEVWCERGELADKLEETTKQLTDFKEREALLANTLVSAEKAASEAKELARKEVELMISEAHQEARSITRVALTERERLFAEARRVETLLRSALGMVEETGKVPEQASSPDSAEDGENWPRREDTREFAAVSLTPKPEQPEQSQTPEMPETPRLSETPASDLGEDDDDKGSPLPPPLPPAAQEPADVEHAEEPDPDQEPNVEVPWTGRNFSWE
jgi:cell division septum initiation protein DivIVA